MRNVRLIPLSLAFLAMATSHVAGAQGKGKLNKYGNPATVAPAPTTPAITVRDLQIRLYQFSDDSMQGRQIGRVGNKKGTDYIAADRVAVEAMGINADWLGYLQYCAQCGIGQYDLSKISIRGAKIADVKKSYRLHQDIERELLWMGPMQELPPKLGMGPRQVDLPVEA